MLDDLLGRTALRERIEELEAELRHAERHAEAEEERRAEAVRARQEAEERVNRLEDRITELEDRIDRVGGEEPDLEFRAREEVRGRRLEEVLDRLESVRTGPEGALTASVGGAVPDDVRDAVGDHVSLLTRAAPCVAVTDDAGLVCAALAPPVLPDPFAEWSDRFELDREWFLPTGEFVFALVRSDLFALGRYDGAERVEFEGFESDVKGNHSKGGFSQARFERRRTAQIDEHVERALDELGSHDAERTIVVGERTVLGEFEDRATHTATADATGDPEAALDDAFREFWTTAVYGI